MCTWFSYWQFTRSLDTSLSKFPGPFHYIVKRIDKRSRAMPRALQNSVVVITGASSGIGRATALAFAESGASLVVAARRAHLLDQLAAECEQFGRRALAVPTDMSD